MRSLISYGQSGWTAQINNSNTPDPLSVLDDLFSTGTTAVGNGWILEDLNTVISSQAISSGELDFRITAGSTGGALWYDGFVGILLYKEVTGACDMRTRIRVRNAANDAPPPAADFRIGGIAAHDPDRTTYEYVHVGAGSCDTTGNRIEWKTTDNSDSAFNFTGTAVTTPLDYDLRLVRRASNLQIFDLYYRLTDVTALSANTGWTLLQTIDRTDDATPNRVTNGGTTAVSLPATLRWGMMVYASAATHDIRAFFEETIFVTPTS